MGVSDPEIGKTRKVTPKISTSINPVQKVGVACPISENAVPNISQYELRLRATKMPRGNEITRLISMAANGIRKASAQNAEALPKWGCQKLGAVSGTSAIDSRIPRKGTIHTGDSVAPGSGHRVWIDLPSRYTNSFVARFV